MIFTVQLNQCGPSKAAGRAPLMGGSRNSLNGVSKGWFSSWSSRTPARSPPRLRLDRPRRSFPGRRRESRAWDRKYGRMRLEGEEQKLTCSSSSVRVSPSSFATRFRFLNEIFPVQSSSNSRKAFTISSLESFSLCDAESMINHNTKGETRGRVSWAV